MTTAEFYSVLFNEGEGICFGLHEHSNRITTLDKVKPESFQYFSLNPFLVDVDLNKMSPNWKAGMGRRDQVNLTARRNMLFEFDKSNIKQIFDTTKFIFHFRIPLNLKNSGLPSSNGDHSISNKSSSNDGQNAEHPPTIDG